MKKNTHPPYRDILFVDSSTGYKFVCGSSLKTDKVESFEGKDYPTYYVSVSSASHPFFTGSNKFIDSEGRVDKFLKRYANAVKKKEEEPKLEVEATTTKSAAKKTKK
jgi:large subunit ribosomal protein L31